MLGQSLDVPAAAIAIVSEVAIGSDLWSDLRTKNHERLHAFPISQETIMPQIITVEISPEGEVKVQTTGFAGASCKQATKALEAALGAVVSDAKTSEFHQGGACPLPQQAKG